MKITQGTILTIVFSLGVGVGAFFVSRGIEPSVPAPAQARPLDAWLGLTPQQARDLDRKEADFEKEMTVRHDRYDLERSRLCDLLSAPSSLDAAILSQLAITMTAHDELQRHTIRNVLAIRPQLTADQTQKLMTVLADYSRGVPETPIEPERGRGQGHGRGRGWGGPPDSRAGEGRGRGWGGPPWRQPRPIYGRLSLPAEQIQLVQKADPDFEKQCSQLVGDLQRENQALTQLFHEPRTQDSAILAQLEKTIAAHDALETRVGRHFLAVRAHLSPEYRRQLMSLWTQTVHKSCCRSNTADLHEKQRHPENNDTQ